jgi:hypothetical protein
MTKGAPAVAGTILESGPPGPCFLGTWIRMPDSDNSSDDGRRIRIALNLLREVRRDRA